MNTPDLPETTADAATRTDERPVIDNPTPEHRELPDDTTSPVALEDVIAVQVRNLRKSAGLSVGELAAKIGISKAMLSKIENAQTSCSLSTLSRLATGLDVPVTTLFRGADAPREAVYVENGRGAVIVGRGTRVGHHYELLGALRGQHRRLEPVLVTLTESSETHPRFQHAGTELLYMLEGVMVYQHEGAEFTLRPGDSMLIDGEGVHGPTDLVRVPIRFLSVTAYPDNHEVVD
ncbi:XRE family transcriptional regulator [Gordonia jinhuaensis]|uniref:Transcriptional regulator n=1 Tax=Gordonia jinhuaensis TaxID=1517702 RepID=A0A916WSX1_9ACTN|nr:transcriptional regulator [Gordonia jinhuaensis]